MKPILFDSGETAFASNGLGVLSDAISCTVSEERNGEYELKLVYPLGGKLYDALSMRRYVFARPRPGAKPQAFKIYRATRPINGRVTFYAQHLSYDLNGIPVSKFSATGIENTLAGLKSHAATECPFDFWTDINDETGDFENLTPASIRSCIGGMDFSVLDMWGGEVEWDMYTVRIHKNRGADRGFTIRYGKNLVDMTQEENISNTYTGVYPYWADNDGNVVELPDKVINADGEFDFVRIMPLDCSAEFSESPSESALREYAQNYIKKNKIGVPVISLTVDFVKLSDSAEYAWMKPLEKIELCDRVTVIFPQLGVSTQATVTRVEYDVLVDRYKTIIVGQAQNSIHRTIALQQSEIAGNTSDIGKNTTGYKQVISYTNTQISLINSKLELINSEIITRTSYVDINNKTLYINPQGKMGTKGTVGGNYALYQGSSKTVDLVHSAGLVMGVLTYDLWRLWFCNGLFIGYTDPSWIFSDGGDIKEWNGN